MNSIVGLIAPRPAVDAAAATGIIIMDHVSTVPLSGLSAPSFPSVPVFLPVLLLVITTTSIPLLVVVWCPVVVLEGDSDVVVLRLSDMRLVNLILRVNGQDGNVNTMCIESARRLLVVLSAVAAARVVVVVLFLDNLSVCSVDMRGSTVFVCLCVFLFFRTYGQAYHYHPPVLIQ